MTSQKIGFWDRWRNCITTVSATAALCGGSVAFVWNTWAVPEIDLRIEREVTPVADAIEFQNYMWMEYLPDSVVQRATKRYELMKTQTLRGRRNR